MFVCSSVAWRMRIYVAVIHPLIHTGWCCLFCVVIFIIFHSKNKDDNNQPKTTSRTSAVVNGTRQKCCWVREGCLMWATRYASLDSIKADIAFCLISPPLILWMGCESDMFFPISRGKKRPMAVVSAGDVIKSLSRKKP